MRRGISLGRFRSFENTARAFALLALCIGTLAVCGWQFGIGTLKSILPTLPVIAPNTAVLFILVALIIFLLSAEKNTGSRAKYIIFFVSGLIFLVGASTIFEYLSGLKLGIDSIFFSSKMGDNVVRMSPQSAFNFAAVGLALFMFAFSSKKGIKAGRWIIVIAGIVSLVSLLGFIYNISNLYTLSPYKGMAAHTAVAFMFVFSGILLLRPGEGFMRVFAGHGLSAITARKLFGALITIFIAEIFVMLGRRVGLYNETYESLIHLVIVSGIFIILIFFAFRSLDQLSNAEQHLAQMKEVDKAKTEFVSLASHQLRTPLTSISWFAEMLMGHEVGVLNEKQQEYLSEIYSQNRRMIDLVDDLLNSSRIDMGMLSLEVHPTDLKNICESVLEELDPLIQNRKTRIEKKYSDNLPLIETDPELARMIFQNLLSNAIKYTPPEGSVIIEISRSASKVEITVSDTGYGIPKRQQEKIFTKMFRADNIRNKETDGTGLGLYIVKAIVRESGGKISFKSEENKGTVFSITLPIKLK